MPFENWPWVGGQLAILVCVFGRNILVGGWSWGELLVVCGRIWESQQCVLPRMILRQYQGTLYANCVVSVVDEQ